MAKNAERLDFPIGLHSEWIDISKIRGVVRQDSQDPFKAWYSCVFPSFAQMATGTSFLEVIRDTDLLKYLSTRSLSALVATCSGTCSRVHQYASAVATAGDRDTELLSREGWPDSLSAKLMSRQKACYA